MFVYNYHREGRSHCLAATCAKTVIDTVIPV